MKFLFNTHISVKNVFSCQRCRQEVDTFWHMVWSCPKLRPFWMAVASTLSNVTGLNIPVDPQILLLSHLEDVEGDRYCKLCLTFSLYYARREILLRWKLEEPPTLALWRRSVTSVLPLYRMTYESRQCPGKFDKIWSSWVDASGDPEPPSP